MLSFVFLHSKSIGAVSFDIVVVLITSKIIIKTLPAKI